LLKSLSDGAEAVISYENKFDLGDSVSINGVCCTVMENDGTKFKVQLLNETLKKTNLGDLTQGDSVNLEAALSPSKLVGGHFVTGHVDETGVIKEIELGDPFGKIVVQFTKENRKYLIPKGSVALDGISLTVGDLEDDTFSCHLVPHTLKNTTLNSKKAGDTLNIEYDMLGKYAVGAQNAN